MQTSGIDICQIGYDICEFDSLRGLGIYIGRVHFDNRDRFFISMGSLKATEPCQQTTEWLLTSDFWLFLEPWHVRWYEYEIFIASCTDSIYDLENERWLFGDMIDHVGIYGSRVAEGLSTFIVGLVLSLYLSKAIQGEQGQYHGCRCSGDMNATMILTTYNKQILYSTKKDVNYLCHIS